MIHRLTADLVLDLSGPVAVLLTGTQRRPLGAGRAMLLATTLEDVHARESAVAALRAWAKGAVIS